VTPPIVTAEVSDLPSDLEARHEALVDIFGSMLFSIRRQALERITGLIHSPDDRSAMGKIFRQPYESVSALPPESQDAAIALAKTSVDLFTRMLLTMLADQGTDHRFGRHHSINFQLILEVMENATEKIVIQQTLNRGGDKSLPNYWGRWLSLNGSP